MGPMAAGLFERRVATGAEAWEPLVERPAADVSRLASLPRTIRLLVDGKGQLALVSSRRPIVRTLPAHRYRHRVVSHPDPSIPNPTTPIHQTVYHTSWGLN